MDEEEDFKALFFVECAENIEDLQNRLDALAAGDPDPETVNAAFRAVHSVKGGAAAFGFEALVEFTHTFETVLDRIRGGGIGIDAELCEQLVRAGDVMALLVEASRDGIMVPPARVDAVREQLEAWAAPRADAEAREPAAAEPADETISVRLAPGADFLISGFDPLKLIRAAREHGLISATPEGQVPPIEAHHHSDCPISWRLEFEPERPRSDLDAFLATYAYAAHLTVEAPAPAEAPPAPRPEAPQLDAPSPEPPPAADAAPAAAGRPTAPKSVRVELQRVDRLVDLVGEVLIAQSALAQRVADLPDHGGRDLQATVELLGRETRALQESVMAIRAQPVRTVFARLPRIVRDLADQLGKQARLVVSGEDVEVDTTVIEELHEPLVHMLRNAMDHGLERPAERVATGKPRTGTLQLAAEQRGGRVQITLADDGRGIDRQTVLAKARERGIVPPDVAPAPEAIDALVFHPGFSTAAEVSSISGRGVGMDVVRQKIQALGGRCEVTSRPGAGTTFVITLPLTLAVMDGMTVRVDDRHFILPLANVLEALVVDQAKVAVLPDRTRILSQRGDFLPLVSLRDALRLPGDAADPATALVVDTETRGRVALLVDDLIGQRQVVLKSLETHFGRVEGVAGATILGDGRVALVLDLPSLFRAEPGAPMERVH
jgi:two-component system, chemotaxis family, sensor kinase CheA